VYTFFQLKSGSFVDSSLQVTTIESFCMCSAYKRLNRFVYAFLLFCFSFIFFYSVLVGFPWHQVFVQNRSTGLRIDTVDTEFHWLFFILLIGVGFDVLIHKFMMGCVTRC